MGAVAWRSCCRVIARLWVCAGGAQSVCVFVCVGVLGLCGGAGAQRVRRVGGVGCVRSVSSGCAACVGAACVGVCDCGGGSVRSCGWVVWRAWSVEQWRRLCVWVCVCGCFCVCVCCVCGGSRERAPRACVASMCVWWERGWARYVWGVGPAWERVCVGAGVPRGAEGNCARVCVADFGGGVKGV